MLAKVKKAFQRHHSGQAGPAALPTDAAPPPGAGPFGAGGAATPHQSSVPKASSKGTKKAPFMVVQDPEQAKNLDAMDGKLDGKYHGVPIVSEDPTRGADGDGDALDSPQRLPYDPRPAWAVEDGYYTTYASDRVVWGDLPPRDAVMAVDQEDAYLLDLADGVLDGTYFGRPIGVHSNLGLASLPPQFGDEPPQYRPRDWSDVQLTLPEYSGSYLHSAPPPKPVPPPPINFSRLPESVAYMPRAGDLRGDEPHGTYVRGSPIGAPVAFPSASASRYGYAPDPYPAESGYAYGSGYEGGGPFGAPYSGFAY